MAVGTVSAADPNQWQLVASATPTGVTSVSFTGLTGYKTYMLALKNVSKSGNSWFYLRFNSDSTTGNYGGPASWLQFGQSTATASGHAITISDANQSVPHLLEIYHTTSTSYTQSIYANPTAITSIELYSDSPAAPTVTFNGGTVYVYGIVG